MKKQICFFSLLASLAVVNACSSDVELYADYKDVAIIYAMLDHRSDTNFVKITRAFCGTNDDPIDASEVALIYDSSNYPGKLDTRIIELRSVYGGSYESTDREIILDTMTLHNKEEGVFYAPDQKVYYTTESLNSGSNGQKYKYRLIVVKPNGDTVTAATKMIGNEELSITTNKVVFQMSPTNDVEKAYFKIESETGLFEIGMQFNYLEQHEGQEMKRKHISRSFGSSDVLHLGGDYYCVEYSLNWLFNTLAIAIDGDTIADLNHPNVVRYVDDFVISASAAGEDLYNYYAANQAQQSNLAGFVSVYSNIDGGYGLFSSRTTVKKVVNMSNSTLNDLFAKTSWGFQEQ